MHIFMGVLAPHDRAFSPRSDTKGRGEYEVTVNAELTRTVIYTATAQEEMLRSKTPSAKHRILSSKAQCRIEYKRPAGTESSNHATTQSTPNHPASRFQRRERRWFVLERPRRDTNGGSETEVTVIRWSVHEPALRCCCNKPTREESKHVSSGVLHDELVVRGLTRACLSVQ